MKNIFKKVDYILFKRLKWIYRFCLLISCLGLLMLLPAVEKRASMVASLEVQEGEEQDRNDLPEILSINTLDDYLEFAKSVNNGNTYANKYVNLNVDLDFDKLENAVVIGREDNTNCRFAGIFDGNGHHIQNLTLSSSGETGLFLNLSGIVCNLSIDSGEIAGNICGAFTPRMSESAFLINCASYVGINGKTQDGLTGIATGWVLNCAGSFAEANAAALNQGLGSLGGLYGVDSWYLWEQTEDGPLLTSQEACTLNQIGTTLTIHGKERQFFGYYSMAEESWCFALPAGYENTECLMQILFSDGSSNEILRKKGEKEVSFECAGIDYLVQFLTTVSVPSIFLDTHMKDSLEFLQADKENQLGGEYLVSVPGEGDFLGGFVQISGHGNDSWKALKKSYNLTFTEKTNLLGLGASKNYVLLAGYRDNSLLAYKITNDLALEIGMDYAQKTQFIHLYIDGNYLGMYFLTGKIEVGKNRLALKDMGAETRKINSKPLNSYQRQTWHSETTSAKRVWFDLDRTPRDSTGGYILEFDQEDYNPEKSRFVSNQNLSMVLKNMPYASKIQVDYIADYWQDFEDALYSKDGYNAKGKYYTEYIDEKSFADQWLFYELNTENSITSSVYFYKDSDETGDGLLHACYPWDMEHSLTRSSYVTYSWFATTQKPTDYWAQFYQHRDFAELVYQEWMEKFLPAIQKALDENENKSLSTGGICSLNWYESVYEQDAKLNNSRWKNSIFDEKMKKIRRIYRGRSKFLSKTLSLYELGYAGFFEENGIFYGVTFSGEEEVITMDRLQEIRGFSIDDWEDDKREDLSKN